MRVNAPGLDEFHGVTYESLPALFLAPVLVRSFQIAFA